MSEVLNCMLILVRFTDESTFYITSEIIDSQLCNASYEVYKGV